MLSNTFVCPLTALNGGLHPFAQIRFVPLRISIPNTPGAPSALLTPKYRMAIRISGQFSSPTNR